ncbi:helix-turn-helix domain-containing protein [Solimonas marina]|uniref:Helix-turn-helix transcriptional regulator n=1 Tax=Solimonas marina TaxID=2714601 RepID=A0A969WDW3_9GAMM|nr:helix-turn-helix transcriptional regulator [Solimonas marina]
MPVPVADDLRAVGLALRRARVARGESQASLARRMGISERTLRDAEKGAAGVSAGILLGLLWAVGQGGIGAELNRRLDTTTERPSNIRARHRTAADDF